jgi:MFS transporter, OFA family, oxalate/formate antiporter
LVPLANVLTTATGSWHAVFYVAAILNIVAAVIALAVLKPMRIRTMGLAEHRATATVAASSLPPQQVGFSGRH